MRLTGMRHGGKHKNCTKWFVSDAPVHAPPSARRSDRRSVHGGQHPAPGRTAAAPQDTTATTAAALQGKSTRADGQGGLNI